MKLCVQDQKEKVSNKPSLAASGWIDRENIGDIPDALLGIAIPEGARLRWILPWNAEADFNPVPKKVRIWRGIFNEAKQFPIIDCGDDADVCISQQLLARNETAAISRRPANLDT